MGRSGHGEPGTTHRGTWRERERPLPKGIYIVLIYNLYYSDHTHTINIPGISNSNYI